MRGPSSGLKLLLGTAALAIIFVSVGLLIALVVFEEDAERLTSGSPVVQFYRELDGELLDDYAGVFAVAHNSGNSIGATKEALAHGADVIEVDVLAIDGRLYAAHDAPFPIAGSRFYRGPTLAEVWDASDEADVIKLDLKDSSASFLRLLIEFLGERSDRQVIVSSRNPAVLQAFEEKDPDVFRFLSVSSDQQLAALQRDPELLSIIDGVTIRHTLLDGGTARWLQEQHLIVLAWTVNDLPRTNELVRYDVDAITTDNLAIMELLGGQRRGENRLSRPNR